LEEKKVWLVGGDVPMGILPTLNTILAVTVVFFEG